MLGGLSLPFYPICEDEILIRYIVVVIVDYGGSGLVWNFFHLYTFPFGCMIRVIGSSVCGSSSDLITSITACFIPFRETIAPVNWLVSA